MKKILFILLLIGAFNFASNAQRILPFTFTGTDTITNSGTVNLDLLVSGSHTSAAFQVINTRVSGTAAGKTYWLGSVDRVNYVKIDSLSNTNVVTNTKVFTLTSVAYPFYRISTTGAGTMKVITAAKAHFKNYTK